MLVALTAMVTALLCTDPLAFPPSPYMFVLTRILTFLLMSSPWVAVLLLPVLPLALACHARSRTRLVSLWLALVSSSLSPRLQSLFSCALALRTLHSNLWERRRLVWLNPPPPHHHQTRCIANYSLNLLTSRLL